MLYHLGGFIFCAGIIFFCGKKLSQYGDIIAELSGMGKAWLGLVVLAGVTSLPELVVGISSSALVGSADLAVGNILGSCAFNLGLLAMLDAFVPGKRSLLGNASANHILAAALGIILIALVGGGLLLPEDIVLIGGIGLSSIVFIAIYLASVRIIYRYNLKAKTADTAGETQQGDVTLKKAILRFSGYALLTVAAAIFLPEFAEQIALQTGIGQTFAGTFMLAVSTSLPEIAVSLAAIRMQSIDLAIGNLLGSNLFNIFILAINDIFYAGDSILKEASNLNLISVLATTIMSAVAIVGLIFRSERKRYLMALDAFIIFGVYIVNIVLLYQYSKS